ncbi:MAG TPA: hypothetical protein VK571_09060 [Gemmatimonadaceae bacterium]|nr:hypothetical protein [Gemmatimonadaceae bacterium]
MPSGQRTPAHVVVAEHVQIPPPRQLAFNVPHRAAQSASAPTAQSTAPRQTSGAPPLELATMPPEPPPLELEPPVDALVPPLELEPPVEILAPPLELVEPPASTSPASGSVPVLELFEVEKSPPLHDSAARASQRAYFIVFLNRPVAEHPNRVPLSEGLGPI